jgi:hypothetical protein
VALVTASLIAYNELWQITPRSALKCRCLAPARAGERGDQSVEPPVMGAVGASVAGHRPVLRGQAAVMHPPVTGCAIPWGCSRIGRETSGRMRWAPRIPVLPRFRSASGADWHESFREFGADGAEQRRECLAGAGEAPLRTSGSSRMARASGPRLASRRNSTRLRPKSSRPDAIAEISSNRATAAAGIHLSWTARPAGSSPTLRVSGAQSSPSESLSAP